MQIISFNKGVFLKPGVLRQIMLVVRIITILTFAILMQVSAAGLAQKITLNEKNASLESVMEKIRLQSGYEFIFNVNDVDNAKKVSLNVKALELNEVLDLVFQRQDLSFSIKDKFIVVKPKEASLLDKTKDAILNLFQDLDVHGRVVDAEGKPLPGATVKVKTTGKAVSTDGRGNFHLKNVEDGAVLVVSYTGYISKEVNSSANMGNVVLEQSLSKLDEVQVIAYGTTTRRLSTGNVSTVKAEDIEKQPVNNPLLALQGRVPGLFIEQATGFAGTGVKVRIQGQNSLNNGNDPLYVIDGIPFTSQLLAGGNGILGGSGAFDPSTGSGNPLSYINPSDIESIDVLKDADATAVYGSRAANGAILITTKKGEAGEVKVDASIKSGWGKVSRRLDLMNAHQYIEMRQEAFKNDKIDLAGPPYNTELYKTIYYPDLSLWDTHRSTDWQKELIGGTAQYNDIQTSISGGSNNTTFLTSAGYHKEGNVFPGDFSDVKNSLHFNITSGSNNQRFKIQFIGSYLYDNNQLPNTDLTNLAMTLAPVAPALYTVDGKINWEPNPSKSSSTFINNPIAQLAKRFGNKTTNLMGNSILTYQVFSGLTFTSSFGYNTMQSEAVFLVASPSTSPPEYVKFLKRITNFSNSKIASWSIEPQLNYKRQIGSGKLDILLGSTLQGENRDASSIRASGFSTDQLVEDIKSATLLTALYSIKSIYKYNALFGRINYNWGDQYIINLTARRDGSSRFGSENQFHNFGAVGAAWIFSESKFLKEKMDFLSFGKLRGSYGTTGNDQISDYQSLSLYDAYTRGIGIPYQGMNGYLPNRLTNPYLQWEETRKLQIGLDLGFLNNKILLNTNYSINRSSNQLLDYYLPLTTGFSGITANFPATIQNTGWEFTLSTENLDSKNFKWRSTFNLTIPRNKLINFVDFEKSSYTNQYIIGQSVNIKKVFHFIGVDSETGSYQYSDKNGNITNTPVRGMDDIVVINPDPKFYGGFQNSFTYKGFQFDVLFQFTKQQGYNYLFGNPFYPAGYYNLGTGNEPISQIDRWRKPGDQVTKSKYTTIVYSDPSFYGLGASDAIYGDASYIRLKNLSISWQLPQIWRQFAHVRSCKLSIEGQNLLTITKYKGLDPETKSSLSLPPLRVLAIGIQIGL